MDVTQGASTTYEVWLWSTITHLRGVLVTGGALVPKDGLFREM
jgi:hypothetical protein